MQQLQKQGNNRKKQAKKTGRASIKIEVHDRRKILEELEKREIEVSGEHYPKNWNPEYDEYKKILEKFTVKSISDFN